MKFALVLSGGGSRVEPVLPDAAAADVVFANLLDITKHRAAAEAGLAQGAR
jgi:hypothetical protein